LKEQVCNILLKSNFSSEQKELAAGVLKQAALTDEPTQVSALYQISTSTALVEGVYSGSIPSSVLLEHGDFGLGTFENLEGEMVIFDGEIYQVADRVRHHSDDFLVPFAAITKFRAKSSFEIDNVVCLKAIELAPTNSAFPTIFSTRCDWMASLKPFMRVRFIPSRKTLGYWTRQKRKANSTSKTSKAHSLASSLRVTRAPSAYLGITFISNHRTKGGHVLDCRASKIEARIQVISEYDIRLPESGPFLTTNLSKDPSSELAKTE
jgi:acetolactate decarboxylase